MKINPQKVDPSTKILFLENFQLYSVLYVHVLNVRVHEPQRWVGRDPIRSNVYNTNTSKLEEISIITAKPITMEIFLSLQSSDIAVGYALGGARILDHVIQTGSDGVEAAIADLKNPDRKKKFTTDETVAAAIEKGKGNDLSHAAAVKEFGLACSK